MSDGNTTISKFGATRIQLTMLTNNVASELKTRKRHFAPVLLTKSFALSNEGATMPEYAVLVAVLLALGLVGYKFLAEDARHTMGHVSSALNGAEVSPTGGSTNVDASQRMAVGHKVNWTWPAVAVVIITFALLVRRPRNWSKKNGQRCDLETESGVEPTHVFEKRQRILHVLSNDLSALLEGRLAVRHVMSKDPVTIHPHRSVKAALALMEETGADYLFVCDRNGKLVVLLPRSACIAPLATATKRELLGVLAPWSPVKRP